MPANDPHNRFSAVESSGVSDDLLRESPSTVVLLAEDDAALRQVLAEMLQAHGYEVWLVASQKRAVARLEQEPSGIDVVVSEMRLPGNGLAILEALQVATLEVPVIVISTDDRPATRRRAYALGAARFLLKPVSGSELRGAIEEVLDQDQDA